MHFLAFSANTVAFLNSSKIRYTSGRTLMSSTMMAASSA